MEDRFKGSIEGIICAAIMVGIFWGFAKIINMIFKKNIGNGTYYTAAVIAGFLGRRMILTIAYGH